MSTEKCRLALQAVMNTISLHRNRNPDRTPLASWVRRIDFEADGDFDLDKT